MGTAEPHDPDDDPAASAGLLDEVVLDADASDLIDHSTDLDDAQAGLFVDAAALPEDPAGVACRNCGRAIAAGEPRYAWGDGAACYACGQAMRGPEAGYVGKGFAAPVAPRPTRVGQRQWKILTAVSGIVLLIPATAGIILYLNAIDRAAMAHAKAQAEAEAARRNFDQLVAIASVQGASKNYDYAIGRVRDAEALLTAHPEWQTNVTADQLAGMDRAFQLQIEDQARLEAAAAPKPVVTPDLPPAPMASASPALTEPSAASSAIASATPTPHSSPSPGMVPIAPPDPTPDAEYQKSLRPPDPQPPAKPQPPAVPVTADDFVDAGSKALVAGDLKTAQLDYVHAQRLQPGNERAGVGQALVMYLRGSTSEAIDSLETLNAIHTTRLSAQNLASMYQSHNMLRSARLMYDYLRTSNTLDPDAFDYYVLGMWNAQWGPIKTGFYWKMTEFYDVYEQQLRLARNAALGVTSQDRRWGTTWISPDECKAKIDQLNEARARMQLQSDLLVNRQVALHGTGGTKRLALSDELANARYQVHEAYRGLQAVAPPMPTDIPFMVP